MDKAQYTPIENIISIPPSNFGLEYFSMTTKNNLQHILGVDSDGLQQEYGIQQFLDNHDHGVEHVYNVYKKAHEIAGIVHEKTGKNIDENLLYIMIALHDSWRFHMEAPVAWESEKEQKRKQHKAKKADSKHEFYGTSLLRFFVRKLEKKWVQVDPAIVEKIREYVYNHDYMTPELNGDRFHEPSSLEWQIARLADRISTPAVPELERYRATWKRLWTPFYNPNITFEDRKNFTFGKMWQYIKAWKLDQFMFFSTLLAVKSKDFAHPVLQELYKEWIPQKKQAVERILSLAKEENIDEATIAQIKKTLQQYSTIYEFDF